jgi:hypothetical protein
MVRPGEFRIYSHRLNPKYEDGLLVLSLVKGTFSDLGQYI